ncbi:MAG: hypothetical protein NZ482_03725 [Gloeomargarita sp. SKYG98]|nr:hypothetical protein [Gloeomargarita sp. SKYG98]
MSTVSLSQLLQTWPTYAQLAALAPRKLSRRWAVEWDGDVLVLRCRHLPVLYFHPDGRVQVGVGAQLTEAANYVEPLLRRRDGFRWAHGHWYRQGLPVDDCQSLVLPLKQQLNLLLSVLLPEGGQVVLKLQTQDGRLVKAQPFVLSASLTDHPVVSGLEQLALRLAPTSGWPTQRSGAMLLNWPALSHTELALRRQQLCCQPQLVQLLTEIGLSLSP